MIYVFIHMFYFISNTWCREKSHDEKWSHDWKKFKKLLFYIIILLVCMYDCYLDQSSICSWISICLTSELESVILIWPLFLIAYVLEKHKDVDDHGTPQLPIFHSSEHLKIVGGYKFVVFLSPSLPVFPSILQNIVM